MSKYNKGEWSEIYVFFKLLGEGKLPIADLEFKQIPDIFYPIISILRRENGESFEYVRDGNIKLVNSITNEIIAEFSFEHFLSVADELCQSIIKGQKTFDIEWIREFLVELRIAKIKAPRREKKDIVVKILDTTTKQTPILGFSIKSSLGKLSSLFNSNQSSNFLFQIKTNSSFDPETVNSIVKRPRNRQRFKVLKDNNCDIEFVEIENPVFTQNLKMVDSSMPNILAKMLIYYYSGEEKADMVCLVERLKQDNPINYDLSNLHPIYEHKIKTLLTDMSLGMTAADVWNGRYKAVGGFIIVQDDGDLVCYHVYQKDKFQEFLLKHSKLDMPASGKHRFGDVFQMEGKYYIKLNLQIRYKT
jgi:hypothetical protein